MIKVSIITVCLNAGLTVESTINSVINQNYTNVQYIIIDGCSRDNTLEIINKYEDKISYIISEPDKGIYDAINKGILLADGDIVGILHANDILFSSSTLANIVNLFNINTGSMAMIGDIKFINENLVVVRNYSSKFWFPFLFRFGVMPPHPSFYCRREIFVKYGSYRTDYQIAADFELLLRLFAINKISYNYLNETIVLMRDGGLSTKNFISRKIITNEIIRACRSNGIYTNYILVRFRFLFKSLQIIPRMKNFIK